MGAETYVGGHDTERELLAAEQKIADGAGKAFRLAGGREQSASIEKEGHWPYTNAWDSSSVIGRRAESGTAALSQPRGRALAGGTGVSRATGAPRRRMMTVSPSSASLMSRES